MTAFAGKVGGNLIGAGYLFSDEDFVQIAEKAHRDFGLYLTSAKKDLVYSRLTKRLRQLGLPDFRSYISLLEIDAAEKTNLLSALTTNVTQFFREEHHFATLKEKVFPSLIAHARGGGRVRIWSAGCSAGQEPYSLAFSLLEVFPDAAMFDIRILATDIDPIILERAKLGVYDSDEVKSLPRSMQKNLDALKSEQFCVGGPARQIISFGELNLMSEWPFKGVFDVIFCRNVAIYFDKKTQERLWQRLAALLPANGYLFIGHSERVAGTAASQFQSCGVTSYRKLNISGQQIHPQPKNGSQHEP